MPALASRRTDAVVAAALAAVSVAQVLIFPIAPRAIGVAIALVSTVPIAFRRAHPVAATLVGTSLYWYPSDGYLVLGYVAGFCLLYSLAVEVDGWPTIIAVVAFVLATTVTSLVWNDEGLGEWLGAFTAILAPVFVGRLVRRERERTRQMSVAEERARIARELHDVVAHGVSVIAVQADAAEAALAHDPERAARPLQTIRGSARDALAEMRRMVGVLGETHERGPQPGLAQLRELIEQAEVPVAFELEGEPVAVPASLDLTAYRIVQEALTNVRKHAGGAPTTVRIGWRPGTLELSVRDHGPGPNGHGDGHGLVGMRERVRIHGGRLKAGPVAGGGFEVLAELPLP
jgi:signal transduction histidine kinase